MIYGYCRVSTKDQKIERQEANIKKQFPDAVIFKEAFTGTKIQGRKELEKILQRVQSGDTIVFDEVSRMSRNAEEGFSLYKHLFNSGVNLFFLKEPHINTDTYRSALGKQIELTGADEDLIFDGINKYLLRLAEKQIVLAFQQAQKEVDYLRRRTSEGMAASGAGEKIRQAHTGKKIDTKKSLKAKEFIRKRNKGFGGDLTNEETWKLAGISKMTFYKYQAELLEEKGLR